jgi:MFS family permease
MGRTVVSVIVGYLAMFVFVFAAFTVTYNALGANGVFKPGSFDVTPVWLGITTALAMVAAIVGGWVWAAIRRRPGGPKALVIVVLVIGALSAIPAFVPSAAGEAVERAADISMFESMKHVKQPVWVAVVTPIIGAVGVIVGARMKKS